MPHTRLLCTSSSSSKPGSGVGAGARRREREPGELVTVRDGKMIEMVVYPTVEDALTAALRQMIQARFADPAAADWLIIGDLNDYAIDDRGQPIVSGLDPLLGDGFCTNLLAKSPLADRWTHYFPAERSRRQLDYMLASPAIAQRNDDVVPEIIRGGHAITDL